MLAEARFFLEFKVVFLNKAINFLIFRKFYLFYYLNQAHDTLSYGCTLYENQFLISSNGRFKAILQTNALFVVVVKIRRIF